jgi:hypothetical protein
MEVITMAVVRSLWGCQHVDWCYMEACGASGGILIMWDRRVVEKMDECMGRYTLACSLRNTDDNFMWAFGGVYGPNDDGERSILWDEMSGLMSWWDMPWCFGGDFNVVRFPSERSGAIGFSAAMEEFSEFISEQRLVIFLFKEVISLAPIIRYGLRLIDFFYLRCHNEDCLKFYRIIFRCCWIVGRKEEETCILSLKICGSSLMVLWNKYNISGRHMSFMACRVMCWQTS